MLSILSYVIQMLISSDQRKHLFRWVSSLDNNYLLSNKLPWLVFDAVDYLDAQDFDGRCVFEYGSGGSTLYWLSRKASCISIEHDPDWFAKITQRLETKKNVDYRLVLPEPSSGSYHDASDPNKYMSREKEYQTYKNYVSQIDYYPDRFFDLILIDGRARASCIKHSVNKVKIGGFIIVDNSERDYYFCQTTTYLENFKLKEFFGVGPLNRNMWKTNVYTRLE